MTRAWLLRIACLAFVLPSTASLGGCGDAPRTGGDGGEDAGDAGDAAMDGALPTEDGGADAGPTDASEPADAAPDARTEDAGAGDGGGDGGPDAGTDAGVDAGPTDGGSPGSCEGDDLRYCESPSDCTPVSCTCSCNGCGGFDYETVVRSGCVDEWYESRGCEPPTICLDVCCPETTVTCVDNQCGATSGSTM